jgi:hypothetical protein
MTKILEATYSNGSLILSEVLTSDMEGKKLRVVVLDAPEVPEDMNQRSQTIQDFLTWSQQISFQLPPDYRFDRDELYER